MVKFLWNYSDTLAPFIVLLVLLLLPNKKKLPGFSWLLAYLIITVVVIYCSNYLADRDLQNLWLYHLYTFIEIWLLVPLLAGFANISFKNTLLPLGIFTVYFVVNIIFLENKAEFNSYSSSIQALILIAYCFIYFLYLVKTDDIIDFQKNPAFWITSGFLFYSILTLILMAIFKFRDIIPAIKTAHIWRVQQVANMVRFTFILIGFLCYYRQNSKSG